MELTVVLHTAFTVALMLAFVGVVIWAFSRRRRRDFDEASRLPLADDEPAGASGEPREQRR